MRIESRRPRAPRAKLPFRWTTSLAIAKADDVAVRVTLRAREAMRRENQGVVIHHHGEPGQPSAYDWAPQAFASSGLGSVE